MNNLQRKKGMIPGCDEGGTVLVLSLAIMTILYILGTVSLFTTNTDLMISKNHEGSVQALYAAEAGAERVVDAFLEADTNGDGVVDSNDGANADNDLDSNGTIDFTQVFTNGIDIGSDTNRVTINAGSNIQSLVWVDASNAPTAIRIHSRGNPAGTKSRKDVTLTVSGGVGSSIIFGALNNST